VLKLPANDEVRLMRHLLEMNWSGTFEACFGIFNDQVVVLSTRTLAELSPGEISRIITVVATIADETTTLYSLNLVQLTPLEHAPLRLIPQWKRRADTDGDRPLVTGAAQAGSFRQLCGFTLGRHRQFRWAIINPTGLNTGSN